MLCNEQYEFDNRNTGLQGKMDTLIEQGLMSRLVLNYTLVQFHWSSV